MFFSGSEAAHASRDETMGTGTILSHNGGGFIVFSFQIVVPITNFATYGKIYDTGSLTA